MITTWLEIGLSNALVATVLAALAFVCTRRMRPQWAFAVWLLVLAKLLVPPVWNAPLGSLRTLLPPDKTLAGIDWLANSDGNRFVASPADRLPPVTVDLSAFDLRATTIEAIPLEQTRMASALRWLAPSLACAWAAGTALWIALSLGRIRRFKLLLKRARRAPAHLQEEVRILAEQLGLKRVPEVRVARRRVSPLVWALFGRPTILLPAGLLRKLTRPQRTALLLHELAHLRRRDHWTKLVELAAIAVYWWLPTAWLARRHADCAAEHCCDALVVSHSPAASRAYAEALLATIDFLSPTPTPLSLGASGFSQFGHVSRRIEMILKPQPRRPRALLSCLILVVVSLAVLPLSVRTLWAEPATNGAKDELTTEPEGAAPRAETPADEKSPVGGELSEGKSGKDWDFKFLTREEFDDQLRELRQKAMRPIETAEKRREAAARQLAAVEKAFETDTTTLDLVLEAQRRLLEADVMYARYVCELSSDTDKGRILMSHAALLASNEALNKARQTWQTVYALYRTDSQEGETKQEAQAREQFYMFKKQLQQAMVEYQSMQENWPYKLNRSDRPRLPSGLNEIGGPSEPLVAATSQPADVKPSQPEKPIVILGPSLDPPSDGEVLRAISRSLYKDGRPYPGEAVRIVTEKISGYIDPPRFYPLIGQAQQHHAHYKCTVYFEDSTGKQSTEVVHIDHNQFQLVEPQDLAAWMTRPPLRPDLLQIQRYKLQLAAEEGKLAGLNIRFMSLFVRKPVSAHAAADERTRAELKTEIAKVQRSVDQSRRELHAARENASKRITSNVDPIDEVRQSIHYFIGSER